MTFTELNLDPKILEAISYMGFENATPIQEKVIPIILEKSDLIACAQTGTGKTGAFVLPILNMMVGKKARSTNTLIIVPTRELAVQIDQQIQGFSYFTSVSSIAVYGGGDGMDWEIQREALTKGADIVIATPGKLLSHLKMGYVNFSEVSHLVLDEADRMLDMGFIDDIKAIISYLPAKRQTLMFSATMAPSIRALAKKILHHPKEISLSISKPAEGVDQKACFVAENDKTKVVAHLLAERQHYDSILVFTSSKLKVNEIVKSLAKAGIPSQGISSNLEQDKREEVLRFFSARQIKILVATDVMSRGIDIKEINMVINFDVPHDAEDYVHRVGRTARVNTKGEAVTLVTQKDLFRLRKIERLIERSIPLLQIPGLAHESPKPEEKGERTNKKPRDKKKNNFKRKKKQGPKPDKPAGQAQP